MRISFDEYFRLAREKGISPFQIAYYENYETTVDTFNDSVESQQIGETHSVVSKGTYKGKIAYCSTDIVDKTTPEYLTDNIVKNAKYGKNYKDAYYCPGGLKYKKVKYADGEFIDSPLNEIKKACLDLYPKIKQMDRRIENVEIEIQKFEVRSKMADSLGMKVSKHFRIYSFGLVVHAKDENGNRRSESGGAESCLSLEDLLSKTEKTIKRTVKKVLDFLGTSSCSSRKCKAVFSPYTFSGLLAAFSAHFNQKAVNKGLSLFGGKVGCLVASKCFTIYNNPHKVSSAAASYDSDGYPTEDFCFIKEGELMTYFRSLESGYDAKTQSNGCSVGDGNAGAQLLTVDPGKKTKDELFKAMGNGIYIVGLSGMGSGLDGQTLDFSLPCFGYLVENGKITKPVSMITVSGNIKDLMMEVDELGKDIEYQNGIYLPSCLVKSVTISGS